MSAGNKLKLLQGRNALDDVLGRRKEYLAYCIHLPLDGMAKRQRKPKGLSLLLT